MPPIGPVYCETPLAAFSFPAEPVNFISNAVIIAFGLVALWLSYRKWSATDVWALAILLTATGIGSALWHGLRTPLSLTLDVVPGLLFLLLFVYVWARRVWGVYGASAYLGAFFAGTFALSWLTQLVMPFRGPPVGVVLAAIVGAGYLIYRTRDRALLLGSLTLLSALFAYTFRSVDLYTCSVIPFGTHFLWHVFLSGGAFLGILIIMKLDQTKTPS